MSLDSNNLVAFENNQTEMQKLALHLPDSIFITTLIMVENFHGNRRWCKCNVLVTQCMVNEHAFHKQCCSFPNAFLFLWKFILDSAMFPDLAESAGTGNIVANKHCQLLRQVSRRNYFLILLWIAGIPCTVIFLLPSVPTSFNSWLKDTCRVFLFCHCSLYT